jgi:hypothetical protein
VLILTPPYPGVYIVADIGHIVDLRYYILMQQLSFWVFVYGFKIPDSPFNVVPMFPDTLGLIPLFPKSLRVPKAIPA